MIIKEKEWQELNDKVLNNDKDRLSLIDLHKKEGSEINQALLFF